MKRTALIIGMAMAITGCQTEEEKLLAEKEALETQQLETTKRLNEIEEKLIKLTGEETINYPDVTAVVSAQKPFEHYITVQGLVEADKAVMVYPEAGGLIRKLPVELKEGQLVKKGELLATFDGDAVAASVKELNEQIALAKYMLDKQQSLYDQGVGTELQLKQAEGQYNTLKQSKNSLKVQQGKFVLRAPFTGYVEKVYVVQGQMTGPTTPIALLVSPNERKVVAEVSESYLSHLYEGAGVNITFPALENETIKNLTVSKVGKYVDPTNRTISIEVLIPDHSTKHVPNLMASVQVRDYADSAALVIPSRLIQKDAQQKSYVFALEKDTALTTDSTIVYAVNKMDVKIGKSYQGETEILAGLTPNTRLVDRGVKDIYEGSKVELVEE